MASAYVPISAGYIANIERTAGTRHEYSVCPQKMIAIAHALGVDPEEVLALRASAGVAGLAPNEIAIALPHGGAVVLRGYPEITEVQRRQLGAVVDAVLCR